jgi:hypothetical protein
MGRDFDIKDLIDAAAPGRRSRVSLPLNPAARPTVAAANDKKRCV